MGWIGERGYVSAQEIAQRALDGIQDAYHSDRRLLAYKIAREALSLIAKYGCQIPLKDEEKEPNGDHSPL